MNRHLDERLYVAPRRRPTPPSAWRERWANLKDGAPYLLGAMAFFGGALYLGTEMGDSFNRYLEAALNGHLMGNEGEGIQAKWITVYSDIDPRGWF